MMVMADTWPTTSASDARAGPAGEVRQSELAERGRRGDVLAFQRLVESQRLRVARLAHRLLGWPDEVDDVVQDVFVSALENAGKFRGDCSPSTWLTTITVNTCRSRRRRLRRLLLARAQKRVEPRAFERPAPASMDREAFARVRQAVQALPARYREVIVLRYLEEMPAARISQVLGVSHNAVEVRLNRARKRLRARLGALPAD